MHFDIFINKVRISYHAFSGFIAFIRIEIARITGVAHMNDLVGFFKVLSDQTRFDILTLLLSREMCVCELVDQLKLSQSLISHHLYHLKVTGLVHMRREGTWIFYSVDHEKLNEYKFRFLKELQKATAAKIPCKFDCCKDQSGAESVSEESGTGEPDKIPGANIA